MSTVVVKVGTSSLTDERGVIDRSIIEKVAEEIATARTAGHQVVLVTSGAIAAGLPVLGMDATNRPTDAVTLQAASSVGQPQLIRAWSDALAACGSTTGQILLAPHNFGDRRQYLHARSTLARLLELDVTPIVNENDAVTDDEIRYGDNDRIAALVAHLVDAEVLVLLTDTQGVLTADPRVDPEASLIEEIVDLDAQLESVGAGAGSVRGSGGMASKLMAARIAAWSAVRTVIASTDRPHVLADAISGIEGVGSNVAARTTSLPARKLWIAFATAPVATIIVDDGARRALEKGGTSLLAAGVVSASGTFERRDAVELADPHGEVFAKGVTRISGEDLDAARNGANGSARPVVVHVDDLVVLAR
ncbi:MAG: glutamate 5-kinase [Acidimicrobiales bacterium]|nr:glutamate 5-kinase [Acidimicrobiales bacterium]